MWNNDEHSLRGVDGIERMRLIRDDIAARVHDLASRFDGQAARKRDQIR
ncbi:hypothetical protein [Mycobacterium kubicae]